ncbi:MAG: hypothetical protein AAGK21_12270 [Bacteroidota bacterium]
MTHSAFNLPHLRRLHRWLTLESWAGASYILGMWLFAGPLAMLLGVAAVVFTPVLVHDLWRLGRWGWLVGFAVVVGVPLAVGVALPGVAPLFRWGAVLVGFYAYTWLLKLAVAEWLRQSEEESLWAREKARWAQEAEVASLP